MTAEPNPAPPVVQQLNGMPVRLQQPADLSWVAPWGEVFAVLDEQDSGNLCLGVRRTDGERLFLKYAGARPVGSLVPVLDAVAHLRRAGEAYVELAHPNLVNLRERVDIGQGHLLVFDWSDAVPMGRLYGRDVEVATLDAGTRAQVVLQLIDFAAHAIDRGWVPVDLYDSSLLVDPATGHLLVCDIDVFERAPLVNTMGRMWGSARFMSPEEFELGATIDERSTVFTLGSLAHALLGDSVTKDRQAWQGSQTQFELSERCRRPEPHQRVPTVASLRAQWAASLD